MNHTTKMKTCRKSNITHERVEAIMAEFGFSWTPQDNDEADLRPVERSNAPRRERQPLKFVLPALHS